MIPSGATRRGFALLTVLLALASAATISMALVLDTRTAFDAGISRVNAERAYWRARGCLAERLATARERLSIESDAQSRQLLWRLLPSNIRSAPDSCDVDFEAKGTRLDVNSADKEQLLALFAVLGFGPSRTDLVDGLLDWIDTDDDVRLQGAERAWYISNRRLPPRNGPLADPAELAHVRGFGRVASRLVEFVGTEPARVSLDHAPAEVLTTLPGFTPEVCARVLERQRMGVPLGDLRELIELVSPTAAEGLRERYPELIQMSVAGTEAWTMRSRARAGSPAVEASIELDIVPAGMGVSVGRWIER